MQKIYIMWGYIMVNILGSLILIIFFTGIIFTTNKRWKNKDFSFGAEDYTAKPAFAFGYITGLLLAVLLGISMSNDTIATYYINGVVFKGGTNWMYIVCTFLIGGGLIGVIIQLISNLPVLFLYSVSEEHRKKLNELRLSGKLPIVVRKRAIIILLVVFSGGCANWFYLKMWKIGFLQIFIMTIGALLSSFEFLIFSLVFVVLMFFMWVVGIIVAIKATELKLKNWHIIIE